MFRTLLILALLAGPALADALDADLIVSPGSFSVRTGLGVAVVQPAAGGPVFEPAPVAPSTTPTEGDELSIAAIDDLDFERPAPVLIFGVAPATLGTPQTPGAPGNTGMPSAPVSTEDDRIRRRNEEAKQWATRPGYFKFVVDKDTSKMAVFDGTTRIGVFSVSFGSNTSEDGYGRQGTRNTPIGVFATHAGRPSNKAFTWFIPYDVPGRTDMGIHGPKEVFLGGLLGLIHWTAGCIATTSRADILTIKAAHAKALQRGTPSRLIIGRGIDFRTIPGW